MRLFYVDESGTGLGDPRSPHFLLAAIVLPADQWRTMDERISALKKRIVSWVQPEDLELKGRDIRRGERLFRSFDWQQRVAIIDEIAQSIAELPCRILAVHVDKRQLPSSIGSDDMMYRLALMRLLELVEAELERAADSGLMMFDSRSDLHSSVQDRRLVDAYRRWLQERDGKTRLVELPWFGFSAFYTGLQLADFTAYILDFAANENEKEGRRGDSELKAAFSRFRHKVELVGIP